MGPRHSPTVVSWGDAVSYERGTPVHEPLATYGATFERRGDNFNGFQDSYLEVKARIWP